MQFPSGHIFHYANVPLSVWLEFQRVPSKGAFYAKEIKRSGQFTGRKITGTCPKCGDVGVLGTRCTDCGCSEYRSQAR